MTDPLVLFALRKWRARSECIPFTLPGCFAVHLVARPLSTGLAAVCKVRWQCYAAARCLCRRSPSPAASAIRAISAPLSPAISGIPQVLTEEICGAIHLHERFNFYKTDLSNFGDHESQLC